MLDYSTGDLLLALCMAIAAALYSSVGHAGASSYLALMALFGVPAATMRPTALVLNILVAALGATRYIRAKLFRWRTFWPFMLGAIPFAFVGGMVVLPGDFYKRLVGGVLLLSAARLLWPREIRALNETHDPPLWLAIGIGALIGLLAGLTGTGGGIFLSPVLLFMAWSAPKPTSGVAALFILVNSIAGLAGNLASVGQLPPNLPLFAGAVLAGAVAGTTLGIRLRAPLVLKALGVVLAAAGVKLVGLF